MINLLAYLTGLLKALNAAAETDELDDVSAEMIYSMLVIWRACRRDWSIAPGGFGRVRTGYKFSRQDILAAGVSPLGDTARSIHDRPP